MLSSDELEDDVFFDSVDCFSSEPVVVKEDLRCSKLDYQVWINEPSSVKDRRESFMRKMGLVRCFNKEISCHKSSHVVELERVRDCSDTLSSSFSSDVSSSSSSDTNGVEDDLVCCGRDVNCQANCMPDGLEHGEEDKWNLFPSVTNSGECRSYSVNEKKVKKWWRRFSSLKRRENIQLSDIVKSTPKTNRMKVKQKKKKCAEFTAVLSGQEIQAHKGMICTMKFSPDGQYLATGGEDGVVCIWRVISTNISCESFLDDFVDNVNESKYFGRKKPYQASIVFPEKAFRIEDSTLHTFHGHVNSVLDLAWSGSNFLLSSSEDQTVRLWQVGCDVCLHVFHHCSYVTCVQFNPMDDKYFISGSIDGKVRIWGVCEKRVVEWADVRDVISAVCYQPDGKGFIVGTISGTCLFYQTSAELELDAELHIQSKRKTGGKRITGIQFSPENSRKVMISSEDSKLRIFDGHGIVNKFKGRSNSGSQLSASFTLAGKHIVSVGEDCHVYVWNYVDSCLPSKHAKTVRACEHFLSEGVSVAIPWSGTESGSRSITGPLLSGAQINDCQESGWIRDSDRFSLGSWFSIDVQSKTSATWPEEKLPFWELTASEDEFYQQSLEFHQQCRNQISMPDSWGLVIVTGGWDGKIRTFHNYGLPVRLH